MSIITKYILKEHVGPLFFSVSTIIFVFLLNIVFRDLGRLLGKGLPIKVIIEFFFLNLAWILALAIPMSVLVATLMAFGRFSSDNEITALKASGVHLYRLIVPVLLSSVILAIAMEQFNNSILPEFNHRVRLLYSDISRKRPALTLEPNVFFDDIPHYTVLVGRIKNNQNLLEQLIINDTSDPRYNKTIFAKTGKLEFSKEEERMVFSLFDGEVHEVDTENLENYRRLKFQRQIFSIPVPNLVLKRSNNEYRGDREKSARMMNKDILNSRKGLREREYRIHELVSGDMTSVFEKRFWETGVKEKNRRSVQMIILKPEESSEMKVHRIVQQIQGDAMVVKGYRRSIGSLKVEIQKKYSIPAACIVFVLIGMPLGIMSRQGGMATAGGLSLVFFLIHWAFLIGGEQLADRGLVGPILAMWAPNILGGVVGIFLLIQTVREVQFINCARLSSIFKRIKPRH